MRRILLPLLVLYVLFDFANPGVPGAVTFDGGVMETAKAERQRPIMRPPLEPILGVLEPRLLAPPPVVRLTTSVMPPPRMFLAQRSDPSVDPVPSADDD